MDISAGNVTPASVIFNNSAKNYVLQSNEGFSITGITGLSKSGMGSLTITNTNSFAGPVTLGGGAIAVASVADGGVNSPLGAGTDMLFAGGALEYTGTDATPATNRSITLSAAGGRLEVDNPSTVLTFGGNVTGTASSGSTAILTLSGSSTGNAGSVNAGESYVQSTLSGVIADGPVGGNLAVVKTGVGGWRLTNANSYSGGTQINSGNIEITNPGALGSGSVNVAAGAQLAFDMNGQTINNNITLNGITTNLNNLNGALVGDNQGGGGGNTLNGTLTLAGSGMSNVTSSWSDKNVNLAGQVTGTGGLQVDLYRAGNGTPWVILSNIANDFAGGIIINSGQLETNAVGVIPFGAGKGDVTVNSGGILNLNGNAQNINGLWGAGVVSGAVNAATPGAPLLTVGNNDATSSFSGVVQDGGATGGLSLAKAGSGTVTLSGASTYSAGTTINNGTLQVGNGSALGTGNLTLIGGALTSNGSTAYSLPNPLVLSGSATLGDVTNNGVLVFTASTGTLTTNARLTINSPVSIDGSLSGSGFGLTKAGPSTLTLSGTSTYTGPTVVAAGKLQLTGLSNVGIKFATNRNGGTYNVTGSAGAVPMSNWNNLTGLNQPTPQALVNSSGAASLAAVTWSGANDNYDVFNSDQADQNAQLLNSYLDNTSTGGTESINVAGVPYRKYNVYVYFASDGNGRNGQVTIGGTTYYYSTAANNGTLPYPLIQTTDTAATYPAANFAEFTGLTGSSFTVNQVEQFNNGIAAVEIVGVTGTDNQLPTTTALSIAASATLDLGGINQQVASLSDFSPGSGGFVTNSGSAPSILTVSSSDSSTRTTFSGTIQDGPGGSTVGLVLSGSGTLVLAGSNTYTGGTDVQGGTLIVANANGLQDGTSLTVGADASSIFGTSAAGTQATSASVAPVPEPATLVLLIAGVIAGLGVWRKSRS